MKKMIALIILVVFLLTGCQSGPTGPQTMYINDIELTVDMQACQVSDGENVYRFTRSGDKFCVVYPNGVTYTRHYFSEWASTDDCEGDISGYVSFNTLKAAIDSAEDNAEQRTISGENILVILLGISFVLIGVFCIGNTEDAWQMDTGWQFKNAEPSDLALTMTSISGIFLLLAGIAMIIGGLFL